MTEATSSTTRSGTEMLGRELKVLYVGHDHCAALFGNLLFMVAQNDPQPSLVRLLPTFLRRLKSQATGPIGWLVVVKADARPPGDEARETLTAAFRMLNESMSFGALVVERTGFVGASMRSVINLLMIASRPTYPLKVFGSLDEAARWMVQVQPNGDRLALAPLVEAMTTLRMDYAAGVLRETL